MGPADALVHAPADRKISFELQLLFTEGDLKRDFCMLHWKISGTEEKRILVHRS